MQCAVDTRGQGNPAQGTGGLSGKHDRTYGRGILLVCQTGHEYRKDDVFTHAGRVQRAAGATHPGGGLRSCVHGTGKGEPSGWKDHPCRRAEKQRAVLQLLPESQPLFRTVAIFPGESGYPPGYFPSCRTDGDRTGAAAGTEERRFTGGITRPKGNRTNYTNLKSPNRMNTNQNARHIYKAEDIDWNGLEAAGISKKQLETSGDMELLLQGKETEIVPLKLRTPVISLTMDATLKLVPDGNGRPVMEINGLRQKETPEI